MSEKVLSAKLEIAAVDKTGKVFTDIGKKMLSISRLQKSITQVKGFQGLENHVEKAAGGIDRMTSSVERLASAQRRVSGGDFVGLSRGMDAAARTAERMAGRVVKAYDAQTRKVHEFHDALRTVGGALVIGAGVATHKVAENGAELQHSEVALRKAGISEEEIKKVKTEAIGIVKNNPQMTTAQTLEIYKEARSALKTPEEAFELLPFLTRAKAVMGSMGVEGGIGDVVKGAESLGLANDHHRFAAYVDGQIKAMAVMGKTITPEQIYEAAKYSKSAGAGLSDEFINLVMPSLIQEMHGSSAGDALSMLTKTLRGGMANKHMAVELLNDIGLLEEPDKIRRTSTGSIKGYTGKVKGDALLSSDPDKWFNEVFRPSAEQAGYKNLTDQTRLLSMVLPSTAANLGRILLQQHETLQNHRKLYEAAPGVDGQAELNRQDPIAAVSGLAGSVKNFLEILASPAMTSAATALDNVARSINGFAEKLKEWQDAHPEAAKNAAYGTMAVGGVVGGTGSIMVASRLARGLGLMGGGAAVAPAAVAGEAGVAAGVVQAGVVAGLASLGGAAAVAAMASAAALGLFKIFTLSKEQRDAELKDVRDHFENQDKRDPLKQYINLENHQGYMKTASRKDDDLSPDAAAKWLSKGDREKQEADAVFREFADGPSWMRSNRGLPVDDIANPADRRRADPAAEAASILPDIKNALNGDARITVEVKPSPDFITRVADMVKSGMSGFTVSGPGSAGQSAPDIPR
ncbi:hypothetical protein FB480_103458 [Agrobacterium vitis]|nr:hypothetical protein FB480_103458 [Agrobacterium vitis]